ncbi:gp30 domain protein [Burkholderia gladioli]|uniref:Gp30 domain protein n=1 Tax=Burkholderia gladioli TaxID=28095 RepID=A0AAW3F647_BURGA|nr:gp30 domain protein [Burkholderia gladioli]KGC16654.1 gp30 domain protein [Burkholderia gladioli]SQA89452.1 Uncharacterised protein [Burkholderia gladioli]
MTTQTQPSPHGARGNRICLCSPIRPRNRRRRSDGLQHGEIGRQDQNRGLDRRLGQEPRARRRRTGFMDFASRLVRSSAAGCRWVDHPSRRRAASRHFGWPWQTTAAAACLRPAQRGVTVDHCRGHGHTPTRHARQHRAVAEHDDSHRSVVETLRPARRSGNSTMACPSCKPNSHGRKSDGCRKSAPPAHGDGPSRSCYDVESFRIRRHAIVIAMLMMEKVLR